MKEYLLLQKKTESWTKHQVIFVFLNLFVTTPTNYCEIPFLFEKEFALTIIQWGKLLWVKNLLLCVYSQGAQSLLCVLCLEEKSGQKKEHWCSAVCWFWLHFEHFSFLNKKARMCTINLKILETAFAWLKEPLIL